MMLIVVVVVVVMPRPALAGDPDGARAWPRALEQCNERRMFAQALVEEANVQPDEAHWAVAVITYREARARGLTICELLMRTQFLAVWHYGEAHPGSWHWWGFRSDPPAWADEIAATVLLERWPSNAARGAQHFDAVNPCGRDGYVLLWQSGQICFYN